MSLVYRLKKFIAYQWKAKTIYYIHSPFVFDFFQHVLKYQKEEQWRRIDELRTTLRKNYRQLRLDDQGTGSTRRVTLAALERKVAVRPRYGKLLTALVNHYQPKTILELGTSIGLSSAYLALGNGKAQLTTLEGSAAATQAARQHHLLLGLEHIDLRQGSFDATLPAALAEHPCVGVVFFDGNHTRQATLSYFHQCLTKADENSIFIFDDIYWSREMTQAWEEIKRHPSITLTIDVFQFGICFFRKDKLAKEDFVLRY